MRRVDWSTIFTSIALTATAVGIFACPVSSTWAALMTCGYHTVPTGPNAGQIECYGNCPIGRSCLEVFTYEPPNPDPTGKKCDCIEDPPE